MKKTEAKRNNVIIEGVITSARIGTTKFDESTKNRLSIKCEDGVIPYELIDECYKSSGARLTPSWVKDRNGYVNVSSKYDVPVKLKNGRTTTFAEFVDSPTVLGSTIKLSLNLKEGAVYPKAIVVIEDGEENDPFADFN